MGGDFAVQAHGELGGNEGQPGVDVLAEGPVKLFGSFGIFSMGNDGPQCPRTVVPGNPCHSLPGWDPWRPRIPSEIPAAADSQRTGRRSSVGAARFQGGVQIGAFGQGSRVSKGYDFGMIAAGRQCEPFPDDRTLPDHHRADRGGWGWCCPEPVGPAGKPAPWGSWGGRRSRKRVGEHQNLEVQVQVYAGWLAVIRIQGGCNHRLLNLSPVILAAAGIQSPFPRPT